MKVRIIVTAILLLLVLIFAIQNSAIVGIKLLFWEISLPRSLLIFMMLAIGVIMGWFLRTIYRLQKRNAVLKSGDDSDLD